MAMVVVTITVARLASGASTMLSSFPAVAAAVAVAALLRRPARAS